MPDSSPELVPATLTAQCVWCLRDFAYRTVAPPRLCPTCQAEANAGKYQ